MPTAMQVRENPLKEYLGMAYSSPCGMSMTYFTRSIVRPKKRSVEDEVLTGAVREEIASAFRRGHPVTYCERLQRSRSEWTKPYFDRDLDVGDAVPDAAVIDDEYRVFRERIEQVMGGQDGFSGERHVVFGERHGYCAKKQQHKLSFRAWILGYKVRYTEMPGWIKSKGCEEYFDISVYKPSEQLMALPLCVKGKGRDAKTGRNWYDSRVLTVRGMEAEEVAVRYDDVLIGILRGDEVALAIGGSSGGGSAGNRRRSGRPAPVPSVLLPVPAVMNVDDDVLPLLHMIDKRVWDERKEWLSIATALKNHAGDKYFDAWMQLSRMSPKYDEADALRTWGSVARADFGGPRLTVRTLHMMAKRDDPISYQEYRMRRVPEVVRQNWCKGDRGLAVICSSLYGDVVKYVGRDEYYHFDDAACVWKRRGRDGVKGYLSEELDAVLRDMAGALCVESASLQADDPKREVKDREGRELDKLIKYVRSNSGMNHVMGYASERFRDEGFVDSLDSVRHLLGVKGGVIDLRTGVKRACVAGDMVYTQLDVEYDENADVAWIDDVVRSAMAGDDTMLRFVQKLLGYAITGEVSEEIFVIWTGSGTRPFTHPCSMPCTPFALDANHLFDQSIPIMFPHHHQIVACIA